MVQVKLVRLDDYVVGKYFPVDNAQGADATQLDFAHLEQLSLAYVFPGCLICRACPHGVAAVDSTGNMYQDDPDHQGSEFLVGNLGSYTVVPFLEKIQN
jgi:hypothetical protein